MPPKSSKKLVFFIQAALFLINFPGFLCQNNSQFANCTLPFQCGTLTNLNYPFWGDNRPLSCGYPGFQLDCFGRRDIPLLTISSITYRVLGIDFSARTLRVARQDLWNTTCPTSLLRNTILNPHIFQFPSDYENVTIYYGCTNNNTPQLPNQFTCDDANGGTTLNLFRTGSGASSGPGTGITCNNSISVPVNQSAVRALESPTANSSINVLQDALANGFLVRWSADTREACESCRGSGGTCGCDGTVCYMETQGSLQVWGVCRVESQGMPPVQSPHGDAAGVVLGVTGAVLLIIISIFCCIRSRRPQGSHNKESNLNVEKFLLQHGSLALKRYKYSEIKKMTNSLSDKLGQGGYGCVYKGKLPDGSLVAVKVLTDTDSNGEDFINEVASISRTSHVNIVNLLGFCFDTKKRALVYEYMPNKSLDKYIGNSTGSDNLDLKILYKIAVGVAKGLEYLHIGCNTRIVHFDIKPQNILLDEEFCPKISDFGLAKLCKKKQSLLSVLGTRGTAGYIAPEVFSRNFGGVSHKSDVYSYGMMVLEMAGANTIVDQTRETTQSTENYFPDKIYEQVIVDVTRKLDGFRIDEEEETARKMLLIGFWCIQTNPLERPSISKVVEMLEGSVESIQIPPKPVLFTPTLPPVLDFSSSFSSFVETEPSAEDI
ncbi:probable receptor-like protein kinase at1g67000 [Phtheirospermum japonicum]|uniref:non-specific serine/threonine protein kinase n=1 Tax=Phtheirospermum japonicum TaxID=374723 RepID=A0A830BEF9_9LAMI|nr:probable receptor-like protein kinase at1g67000 [Phtheirospermum japonicum]GFP85326.1 probable receptor-like protein kinase at1g67000 [Phtheirospermum japonicum]